MNDNEYDWQVRWAMIKVGKDTKTLVKPGHIIAQGENNWFWWECHIGIESLVIKFNGDIYRWQCRVGGKIGSIYEADTISFPTSWVQCNKRVCSCAGDVLTTKKRN
jgi:hypothetical protein